MILLACLLSFLSASIFVMWIQIRRDKSVRRRIEQELWKKNVLKIGQSLLRDDKLSGFRLLQNFLHSLRLATRLSKLIEQSDLKIRVGTLILMIVVMATLGLMIGHAMHLGWALTLVIGLFVGSIPYTYVRVKKNRRMKQFEKGFPEAVDLMARAIRAGHAFSTGIQMVADEMPDPVGKEFRRVFEEQNLGLPLRNALMGLLDRVELVDLKLFVVAVLVQHQSGGNLAEILDKIAQTIRARFRILRQLRVYTAQAKLTGLILTVLPPVLGVIIYSLNYEYMKVLFTETWGLRILMCALVLQITGFLWIRKIVNIEV